MIYGTNLLIQKILLISKIYTISSLRKINLTTIKIYFGEVF
jgi:hypothetical protein